MKRGTATFYVDAVPDIPKEISFKVGDALHNLRSTLDHLAWSLVDAAPNGILDQYTSFPIFATLEAYKSMSRGKVKGLGEYCLDEIDRMAPLKNGFGHWVWQLHRLDIVNKHRLLLTVASVPIGRTMLPDEKAAFHSRRSLVGPVTFAVKQLVGLANAPPIRAVQAGDVLGTFPISEMREDMGFAFDVAIDEPEYVAMIPMFRQMRFFAGEVLRAVTDLARFL